MPFEVESAPQVYLRLFDTTQFGLVQVLPMSEVDVQNNRFEVGILDAHRVSHNWVNVRI